ncbi:MAG: hypothetical protein U1E65_14730 [Myxococcota bacterium]
MRMPRLAALFPLTLMVLPALSEAAEVRFRDGYPVTTKDSIYRLSEVKVGDRGTGYTVFVGAQPKPFSVEVLGIMKGMLGPDRSVILAKLSGPEIEFYGVIAGMSGSPVYIDGRLVGAVSYRFGSFSKEPIAGITPIESMLDLTRDPQLPKKLAGGGGDGRTVFRLSSLRSRALQAEEAARPVLHTEQGDLVPIATPIMLGGFPGPVAASLERSFAAQGMIAVAGAAGSAGGQLRGTAPKVSENKASIAGGQVAPPILPAAPISGLLMRGDFDVAGTGTVTFVEDGLVLAFGHPFFGYGNVAFPMHTAAILNTLASLSGSYKMSAAGLEVGSITHDRLSAIGGRLGQSAPMVPVRVKVDGEASGAPAIVANVEIIDNDLWLPVMLGNAINAAAHGRIAAEAGGTAELVARYQVGDKTLVFKDSYSVVAPYTPGALAAQDVGNVAGILVRNGLARAPISKVEVELKVRSQVELAWLEELTPERTVVKAGERLKIKARLRPFRARPMSVPVELTIPRDARGEIDVFVGGSAEIDQRDDLVWGDRALDDLDDLLGYIADRRAGRGLYARAYLKRPGLRTAAELSTSLPPSQRLAFEEEVGSLHHPVAEAFGPESSVAVPAVVIGGLTLKIQVQDP